MILIAEWTHLLAKLIIDNEFSFESSFNWLYLDMSWGDRITVVVNVNWKQSTSNLSIIQSWSLDFSHRYVIVVKGYYEAAWMNECFTLSLADNDDRICDVPPKIAQMYFVTMDTSWIASLTLNPDSKRNSDRGWRVKFFFVFNLVDDKLRDDSFGNRNISGTEWWSCRNVTIKRRFYCLSNMHYAYSPSWWCEWRCLGECLMICVIK